jgi:hypothetical protein
MNEDQRQRALVARFAHGGSHGASSGGLRVVVATLHPHSRSWLRHGCPRLALRRREQIGERAFALPRFIHAEAPVDRARDVSELVPPS